MRREVLSYFRGQPVVPYDGMTLLDELPFQLRMKLLYHLYSSVVYLVPFLKHSAGHNKHDIPFVIAFCSRLREQAGPRPHPLLPHPYSARELPALDCLCVSMGVCDRARTVHEDAYGPVAGHRGSSPVGI